MVAPKSQAELTALFTRLGAKHPESWANSEIKEGIPQLMRYLFLRGAWSGVKRDGDTSWIEPEIIRSKNNSDGPYAGLGLGLKHCLERGVNPAILTEMMRCAEAAMIFHIGLLLDAPEFAEEELEDVSWGLFQTDENETPDGPPINGLSESVLDLDPTGREMRPPSTLLSEANEDPPRRGCSRPIAGSRTR